MNFSRYSMPILTLIWAGLLFLFPVLLVQAFIVRRNALRLPDGAGPREGCWHNGLPIDLKSSGSRIRVLGLGDSVIAGTGISTMEESLMAAIARQMSEQTGDRVAWEALGENGHRAADLEAIVKNHPLSAADLVVISIGVNDVTGLTSLLKWQSSMIVILGELRRICRGKIVLVGLPPMERFTVLPMPLSWLLGVRAAMLGRMLRQFSELMQDVIWIDPSAQFTADLLAEDGYHPNETACDAMANEVIEKLR